MGFLNQFAFVQIGNTLSEVLLDAFENELGHNIDRSYRQLLMTRNGGVPRPALTSSIEELPYEIQVFFSLEEGHSGLRRVFADCDEILEELASPLQGRLLPIASDFGDRYICMKVGSLQSEMYLCSLDRDAIDPVHPLGVDFGEFIDSLSQPDPQVLDMEALASQSWDQVRRYIANGGPIVDKGGGLSLLCQTIRCDKPDLFAKLIELEVDMEDAIEVAVINNRIEMLKVLIEKGGDAQEGP